MKIFHSTLDGNNPRLQLLPAKDTTLHPKKQYFNDCKSTHTAELKIINPVSGLQDAGLID